MPLSVIDPIPALLVVDLQIGVVALPLAQIPAVVERSVRLIDAFRAKGHPVALINVEAGPRGRTDKNPAGGVRVLPPEEVELVAELGASAADILITKHTRGAFHGTSLEQELAQRGVTQVFVVGVATGSGVEETAREAYARGLHVVAVTDAMTDSDPVIHEHAVAKVFPKFAQTATTDEVLDTL